MAEATCRRELDLEIPAEEVTKKIESVAKEFARLANVPGFRRGKALGAESWGDEAVRAERREASIRTYTSWVRSIWKTLVTGRPRLAVAFQ